MKENSRIIKEMEMEFFDYPMQKELSTIEANSKMIRDMVKE